MAGEVASSSKPQLRGLHHAVIKKNIGIALSLCAVVVVGMKFLFNDPRKNQVGEFYKNYDANKSFERMKAAGVLKAAPPGS